MKRDNIYLWVALENAVAIICWSVLAVLFDKWWIALFSILFIGTVKTKEKDGDT